MAPVDSPGPPDTEATTVLHVDDEPAFAEMTAAHVERLTDGIGLIVESDASDALDRLSEQEIDCIVSDYQMPGMNGLTFLEQVRDTDPDLPFVLYTAHGSEAVASDALSLGATDYLQKGRGADQYELLVNRITNAVESYRVKQRAADLERVEALVREINQILVRSSARDAIESQVCTAISEARPYQFAWIGRHDAAARRVEPTAWSGLSERHFERVTVTTDDSATGRGPVGRAIKRGRFQATQHVHEDPTFEPWRDAVDEQDVAAVCALPLTYDETLHGVLVVGAKQPYAFDERERELLTELGDDIAHALDSLETRAALERERDRRGALFENAPDPIVEVTFEREVPYIERVNSAFEETFGFESTVVGGDPIADVLVPETERAAHDELRRRVFRGETVEAEVRRETADGVREFLLRVIPIDVTDVSNGAYAWYSDITKRKQHEQELEATQRRFEAVFNN